MELNGGSSGETPDPPDEDNGNLYGRWPNFGRHSNGNGGSTSAVVGNSAGAGQTNVIFF